MPDARGEGYSAYHANVPRSRNPHDDDSDGEIWLEGWDEAHGEAGLNGKTLDDLLAIEEEGQAAFVTNKSNPHPKDSLEYHAFEWGRVVREEAIANLDY